MIKGIDISQWQGSINFAKLPKEVEFLVIRSSYGTGYTDKFFTRNRDEARKLGKAVGFYTYAYPTYNTPEAEAEWFHNVVKDLRNGEFLVLDFEEKYNDPVGWSKKFLDKLSTLLNGYKPLIYLNKFTIDSYDWKPVVEAGYGLWLAYWDYNPDKEPPHTDWPVVAMRQYTNNDSIPGITGRVDANVFYGDVEQLSKYGVKVETPCADEVLIWKEKCSELTKKLEASVIEKGVLERTIADCRIDIEVLQNELQKLKKAIGENKTPLSNYKLDEIVKELLVRLHIL